MSSKLSQKKDEKLTPPSPSKKDSKSSPPLIMTRQKAVVMNTRQLRNQDASRKKISAFTQLLLSPTKDKTKFPVFNKKRSPRDKKNKTKDKDSPKKRNEKRESVKVTQLVLDTKKEVKTYGRKRKNEAEPKDAPPAKRPEPLSVHELMDLVEEQSLDDEDFLEILTCPSPVWWEQPDNLEYCEDAITTTAEQKRYFQQFFKTEPKIKTEIPDIPAPAATNINIPEVKTIDDKFMKKRNKLENLLENIKHKLTKEDKQHQVNEQRSFIQEKTKIKENNSENITKEVNKVNDKATEDKIDLKKARHVRPPSESTSSSDDMFFGFQNEEILKDLENMSIPIKEDEPCDSIEPTNVVTMDNKDIEKENSVESGETDEKTAEETLKTERSSPTNHTIQDKNPKARTVLDDSKEITDASKENHSDTETKMPKTSESFDTTTNTAGKKGNPSTESILEKRLSDNNKTSRKCKSSNNQKSNTSVQESAGPENNVVGINTIDTHNTADAVKIYYIDVSTPKDNKTSATKKDDYLRKGGNSDEVTKLNADNEKSSSSSITGKQLNESSINKYDGALPLCKEKETLCYIAKHTNELKGKSKESTKPTKGDEEIEEITMESNNSIPSVDKDEVAENLVDLDKNATVKKGNMDEDGTDSIENEKDNKVVKPKVNKNQLMAVYKIITEQQYKQNCIKTAENEVQSESNTNNLVPLSRSKTLDADSKHLPSAEIVHTKENEIPSDKEKSCIDVEVRDKISDVVSQNVVNKSNEIDTENKTAKNIKDDTQNKNSDAKNKVIGVQTSKSKEIFKPINVIEIKKIKENKTTQQTDAEIANKTDSNDNKEKLCGNCEESKAETSFNITSTVKSAKYCLKCSSIFESETCSYCAKKSQLIENKKS